MYNFLQNVINELETNFTAKTNVAEWFSLHLKTHLSKNITLEDWNTLQVYIKNNVSDIQSLKNSLTDILNILNHEYVPTKGGVMFGNLKMKGNNIIFDEEEDSMKIGYDENGAKMSIDMQNSDYYKAHYHASGFRIGNGGIEANLDTEESRFEFSLGSHISTITPDGYSVRKEGTTFYNDGEITRYPDNSYLKHVEIKLPNESGTIALDKDIPTKTSQLTNDSNYATTNQLFSKNYNDLTNKPSIPSSTNQLTNNSGFITNTVNNLTNYYLKSEIYTKSEVQQLLSTISSLNLKVVTNLPTTNISTSTIYLKPLDSAKENNIYEEYIYINNKWETIGTTAVDLSNYALKTDIPTKLSQLEQDVELGVSEEDVMEIVEKNAEQTDTLDVGTSATFNPESDKQIPTSKAVAEMVTDAVDNFKVDEFEPAITNLISRIEALESAPRSSGTVYNDYY